MSKLFKVKLVFLFLLRISSSHLTLKPEDRISSNKFNHSENYFDLRNLESDHLRTWCDPTLGCLNITKDWYSFWRPVNPQPFTRKHLNTEFFLHTRKEPHKNEDYIVSVDNITNLAKSTFDGTNPTLIIVHGFLNSGDTHWLKEMASDLIKYGDYNVLRVEWHHGSRTLYSVAAANSRVVGLEIAHFVNELIKMRDVNPKDVHCIGHSLGAHACGYAGERVNKIGRITGLDPAGPYFSNTPDFVHLDPTDATFVDVIHTDIDPIYVLGYGTAMPMGHLDFFPNGGYHQPGCLVSTKSQNDVKSIEKSIGGDPTNIFACDHLRSIKFFTDSLQSPTCNWLGHECPDYGSFEQGQCYNCDTNNKKCAYMGIEAFKYVDKSRNFAKFFLNTDRRSPFCVEHYQISILTAYPKKAEKWVIGSMSVTLHGNNGEKIKNKKISATHERIEHGQMKRFLFTSHVKLGHITKMEVRWYYNQRIQDPSTYCLPFLCNSSLYLRTLQVKAINYYPQSKEKRYRAEICGTGDSVIRLKDARKGTFTVSNNCYHID